PLWDPDALVRARIGTSADERSQWEWWAGQQLPQLRLRNHGVYGERTDQIRLRLETARRDAGAPVVPGRVNAVVQARPIADAAADLHAMALRGQALGLAVVLVDVLPWNNGDARAAGAIVGLNGLIRDAAAELGVPLVSFHAALVDRDRPHRMR